MEKLLLNKDNVKIWYNSDNQVLYATWKGFLKKDQVVGGCSLMTEFIKKNGVQNHLSNHVELKVLSKEVQDYLTEQWFPEVEKVGLKKVAALVSDDVFAKATVEKVNKVAKVGKLTISTFNAEKDSLNWLLEGIKV